MPCNSNTLFQKMPDKVSFLYAQISEKWLELFLKKFPSYTFRNNVESETVLYLTNGRKGGHLDHLLGDYENEKSYLGLMIVYPEQLK